MTTPVVVRPTIAADLEHLKQRLPHPGQAVTMLVDGVPVAAGGVMRERGLIIAWATITPDARAHPIALHKAARAFHRELQRQGIRTIYASDDPDIPASSRWLERHGFQAFGSYEGRSLYRWQIL